MSEYTSVRMKDTDAGAFAVPLVTAFEEGCELERINEVPEIEWRSIGPVRTLVGRGAFSNVYHVFLEKPSKNDQRECKDEDVKQFIRNSTVEDDRSKVRQNHATEFALKRLNSVMPADHKKFRNAACDIALEASLLQRLQHPNIITLHGVKSGDLEEAINYRDFFLVLDFLTTTLSAQFRIWKKQGKSLMVKVNRNAKNSRLMDRLEQTALGIANGMEYLHSKNIVFRDLKPDNIGFDRSGEVRIFDFGLARDLSYVKKQRHVLGCTGTIRYMANEICKGIKTKKPYGLKVDVYSFGVVLWEICTLQVAFDGISNLREHSKRVVKKGERPSLKLVRIPALKELLGDCWDPSPDRRPNFTEVRERLDAILSDYMRMNGTSKMNNSTKEINKRRIGQQNDQEDRTQLLSFYFQNSSRGSKR